MADIANVTGTLDDKELNFQHSIGTVYKASASIDGSEKDHVAVLTATDSAGNSTTETMVISISGSWTTPKTDWYGYTDDDGIYHGDRFNTEDFNRIKNNLAYLREIAVAMYQEFSINDLGKYTMAELGRGFQVQFYGEDEKPVNPNYDPDTATI